MCQAHTHSKTLEAEKSPARNKEVLKIKEKMSD